MGASGQSVLLRVGGTTPPLALQMCVCTPPTSPVQVRLVLAGYDSHASLLCTLFRTFA